MPRSTWRFEFVDINKSIVPEENESSWIGFATIRAPKGTTAARYIPAHNPKMIEQMFGYASADWPDLYEVLDFNNEYGLYISAPTVDTVEYPNYYGGVYFTKNGFIPMYRVTNKKAPNWEMSLSPGREMMTLNTFKNSKFELKALNAPGNQAVIKITGVDPMVFQKTNYIDFEWSKKGIFRYRLDKVNGFILADSSSVPDTNGQQVVCGTFKLVNGKYDFTLGGVKADQTDTTTNANFTIMNTAENWTKYRIPFIDFNSDVFETNVNYHYENYLDGISVEDWEQAEELKNAIVNGGVVKILTKNGTVKLTYNKPLKDRIKFICDIEEDVYSYHVQPSTTGVSTKILIDKIVYDKYNYNRRLYYTTKPEVPSTADVLAKTLTGDGYLALLVEKDAAGEKVKSIRVMQYEQEENEDTGEMEGKWVDKTSEFETDAILAFDSLDGSPENLVHHKIYRVLDGALTMMTEDAEDEDFVLQKNIYYNSYHSMSTEVDAGGEIHESGNLTGSLDEFGVDENNGDIYWEELIKPDDSIVFAEVYVVRTFDKDLDENGIYTGPRFEGKNIVEVKGQRYVDYVVNLNIKAGKTGGNCTDTSPSIQKKFLKIIKEGLLEAAKPKYADTSLFMEFTGLEGVRAYLPAVRTTHYTSTIISPLNINQQLFDRMSKARVSNRIRGSAVYCQELLYKDKNIRKKYYACPIGAMGVMLMRIMEGYYGGRAPMWLNEGNVGGQIGDILLRNPIEARWDFEDLDTKVMDQKGINPIMYDVDDGVMATSHKTTELNGGDWSYLAHSMSFDLCKREIRDNVMKPQLGKMINPHYIELRQSQTNNILEKRTGGSNPIWSYAKADLTGANTDYTRAQKIFMIPVEVRVYPSSERIRLSFTNLSQTTAVSD